MIDCVTNVIVSEPIDLVNIRFHSIEQRCYFRNNSFRNLLQPFAEIVILTRLLIPLGSNLKFHIIILQT